ncbi:hypothetical protein J6590_071609 [Homalodisca vitripennis]|nr:hypothetical protein J6590_071609 [Homalodisca vitripennis]
MIKGSCELTLDKSLTLPPSGSYETKKTSVNWKGQQNSALTYLEKRSFFLLSFLFRASHMLVVPDTNFHSFGKDTDPGQENVKFPNLFTASTPCHTRTLLVPDTQLHPYGEDPIPGQEDVKLPNSFTASTPYQCNITSSPIEDVRALHIWKSLLFPDKWTDEFSLYPNLFTHPDTELFRTRYYTT